MTARQELPIFELERALVSALRAQPRLILQAPTGSGKSTQVPQILLDHGLLGDGEVVILQPRRLAARLLAARVASERNGKLGEEVGCVVVPHPGQTVTEQEIRDFASARLAAFKVPRRVLVMDDIPKGATGKVQRIGLAEKLGLTA